MEVAADSDRSGPPSSSNRDCGEDDGGSSPFEPPCFVIVHNISKKHNVGALARCATAFGVKEVMAS